MIKRLALTTVVAAVALVPAVGASAQYPPDPGGMEGLPQILPIDPGGETAFPLVTKATHVKHAKKAVKLPYLGRH
jgi:hypothetical protein